MRVSAEVRALSLSALAVFGADEPGDEDESDLDNTGVVRDHFLSLYRRRRFPAPDET
jgi:hypothetical protein